MHLFEKCRPALGGQPVVRKTSRLPGRVDDRHTVEVNAHDYAFSERHRAELEAFARSSAVTPTQLRERREGMAALGATRAMVWPIRPDWERGLRSFAPLLTS